MCVTVQKTLAPAASIAEDPEKGWKEGPNQGILTRFFNNQLCTEPHPNPSPVPAGRAQVSVCFLPAAGTAAARPGGTAAVRWDQGLQCQYCHYHSSDESFSGCHWWPKQSSSGLGLLQEQPSSAWCKLGATQSQGIPSVSSAILPLMLPPDHRAQKKLPGTSAGRCRLEHVPTFFACRLAGEKTPQNFRAFVFC